MWSAGASGGCGSGGWGGAGESACMYVADPEREREKMRADRSMYVCGFRASHQRSARGGVRLI